MSSIRVVLTVTPASPELFAGLKDVPARLRAERVRTLATLGLAAVSGGIVPATAATPPHALAGRQSHGVPNRALTFAKSLVDGV